MVKAIDSHLGLILCETVSYRWWQEGREPKLFFVLYEKYHLKLRECITLKLVFFSRIVECSFQFTVTAYCFCCVA